MKKLNSCGRWLLAAALFSFYLGAQAEDSAPTPNQTVKHTIKVGDPAPKLYVGKWINGDPVKEFEKNKIYVIEFWATWCGPCREAIPELSELNTRYKTQGVTFIGMNVLDGDQTLVEPFVKKMGKKMNYRVGIDKIENNIGLSDRAWLDAANISGIPCTFIIDRQGLIAWIGHPDELPPILAQVVAGKNIAENAVRLRQAKQKFDSAAQTEDGDGMLKAVDEIVALDPSMTDEMESVRFKVLLMAKKDYEKAYQVGDRLAENQFKANPQGLNEIAWLVLDSKDVTRRDYDLALKWISRADELTKHSDPLILDTLARAHFEKGDVNKAIETESRAIQMTAEKKYIDEFSKSLEKYKQKKG